MNWRPLAMAGVLAVSVLALSGMGSSIEPAGAGAHPAQACTAPYYVSHAGWDLCWQQDDMRAQGIEINRAFFQERSVAWKMGVPFTLTHYDETPHGPFKDTLGKPGDAGLPGFGRGAMALSSSDCPRFYMDQATLLNNDKVCVEKRGGPAPELAIWGRYDIFNYRFLQGWKFDDRGHITPLVAMGGHLIDGSHIGAEGSNHHHHIYWRIDFDVGEPGNDSFQKHQRLAGGHPFSAVNLELDVCDAKGSAEGSSWCDVPRETMLVRDPRLHHKWRVVDSEDRNSVDRERSYEFSLHHSDHPPYTFSTFDVMVVEYKGDTEELGYEVPTVPPRILGDRALHEYVRPPEKITDPVVWAVLHVYHDTRDEDRGTMSYHWAELHIRPNNFVGTNPGEATFP